MIIAKVGRIVRCCFCRVRVVHRLVLGVLVGFFCVSGLLADSIARAMPLPGKVVHHWTKSARQLGGALELRWLKGAPRYISFTSAARESDLPQWSFPRTLDELSQLTHPWHDLSTEAPFEKGREIAWPVTRAAIQTAFLANIKAGHTVLEVGAGNGFLHDTIAERLPSQVRYIESDIVPRDRPWRRTETTESMLLRLPHDINLPDSSVDQVNMIGVLDTIAVDQLAQSLQQIERVLRPGGYMVHWMDAAADYHMLIRDQARKGRLPFPLYDADTALEAMMGQLRHVGWRFIDPEQLAALEHHDEKAVRQFVNTLRTDWVAAFEALDGLFDLVQVGGALKRQGAIVEQHQSPYLMTFEAFLEEAIAQTTLSEHTWWNQWTNILEVPFSEVPKAVLERAVGEPTLIDHFGKFVPSSEAASHPHNLRMEQISHLLILQKPKN